MAAAPHALTALGEGEAEPEAEPEPAKPSKIFAFSTTPEQVQAVLIGLFDKSLESVQAIPKIDLPYSMEEAFELRMSNNGTMPLLPLAAANAAGVSDILVP